MKTEEKKKLEKKGTSEKRNCLQKCFHSFKYIINQMNVYF